eukprot:scaffold301_cov243-Pinguiococcus_pyrenoidosus.AAC.16
MACTVSDPERNQDGRGQHRERTASAFVIPSPLEARTDAHPRRVTSGEKRSRRELPADFLRSQEVAHLQAPAELGPGGPTRGSEVRQEVLLDVEANHSFRIMVTEVDVVGTRRCMRRAPRFGASPDAATQVEGLVANVASEGRAEGAADVACETGGANELAGHAAKDRLAAGRHRF